MFRMCPKILAKSFEECVRVALGKVISPSLNVRSTLLLTICGSLLFSSGCSSHWYSSAILSPLSSLLLVFRIHSCSVIISPHCCGCQWLSQCFPHFVSELSLMHIKGPDSAFVCTPVHMCLFVYLRVFVYLCIFVFLCLCVSVFMFTCVNLC